MITASIKKVEMAKYKKDDKVKIIKCDCSFWPLEHNGQIGEFESKTPGGNYYVNVPYDRCIAKKIVRFN